MEFEHAHSLLLPSGNLFLSPPPPHPFTVVVTVNCEYLSCPPTRLCELTDGKHLFLFTSVTLASSTALDTNKTS